MPRPVVAWSYSRFSDYDRCAALYGYKHVQKLAEEENAAMERGNIVHKTLAQYVRGDIPLENPMSTAPIPGWTYFGNLLNELREMDPLVEQEWGFTNRWRATGWFSNDTWFRSKLDVGLIYEDNTAEVIDFKTGKKRPEHKKQAELYAISLMCRYPQIESVSVRYWYLDVRERKDAETVYRFSKENAVSLLKLWTSRAEKMLADKILAPNPGAHCGWCSYSKSKNGPCKYG